MARIETIPTPICERSECDRTATFQVVSDDGRVLGRYCSAHGMSALRQAEKPRLASYAARAPKEAVAR